MKTRRNLIGNASIQCLFEAVEARQLMCNLAAHDVTTESVPVTDAALALDAQISAALRGHAGAASTASRGGTGEINPFNIVWTNRGSDGFSMFGANAAAARAVVDAAIVKWEAAITDMHQVSGNNRLDLTISMKTSGATWGGGASGYVYDSAGRPTSGVIEMNRGGDTNGDGLGDGQGWFIDPTPLDNAEFTGNAINAYAPTSASIGSDFLTVLNSEIIHTLGISADSDSRHNMFPKYSILPNYDVSEGGGVGLYAVYQGPSIRHLMTTNNGGATGSDRGSPLHGAGVKMSGTNTDAPLFSYAGVTWKGAEDATNANFEGGTRYLIPQTALLIMQDSLGYTLAPLSNLDNSFAILNRTTGALTVRGGDMTGGNSNDVVDIDIVNGMLRVSVDASNDVAGTGTLSGPGNLPAWVSDFELADVNSISINTGNGADVINIRDLYHSTSLSINTGAGADSINIGKDGILTGFSCNMNIDAGTENDVIDIDRTSFNGTLNLNANDGDDGIALAASDFDTDIGGNATLLAGNGVDTLTIIDSGDTAGSDTYTFGLNSFARGSRTMSYSGVDNFNLYGSNNADTFNINDLADGMNVTLRGANGNDIYNVSNGDLDAIMLGGRLDMWGEADNDKIVFNDISDVGNDTYNILATSELTKNGLSTILHYTSFETFELQANSWDNVINTVGVGTNFWQMIYANGGYDTLNAVTSNDLDLLAGNLYFDGGAHTDTINLNDSGDFWGPETYTINSTMFTKSGATGGLLYINSEAMNLTANNGDSTILANANPGTLSINSAGGNDSISVETTDVLVNSGTGDDSLTLNADGTGVASAVVSGLEQLQQMFLWLGSTLNLKAASNAVLDVTGGLVNSGVMNLADGKFIRRGTGGFNPTFNTWLKNGYNNGAWNGSSPCIRSSVAALSPIEFDAIGYTTAGEAGVSSFGGVAVNPGDHLFGYTQYGDTDLDRDVDFDDLLKLSQNYNTGSGKFWGHGDFTFDGLVNFDDLLIEAQRYGSSLVVAAPRSASRRNGIAFSDSVIA